MTIESKRGAMIKYNNVTQEVELRRDLENLKERVMLSGGSRLHLAQGHPPAKIKIDLQPDFLPGLTRKQIGPKPSGARHFDLTTLLPSIVDSTAERLGSQPAEIEITTPEPRLIRVCDNCPRESDDLSFFRLQAKHLRAKISLTPVTEGDRVIGSTLDIRFL